MIAYKILNSELKASVKSIDGKQGIVSGYFAAFNNIDADGDIIRPGAFTKTISENFNRIKHLLNHNCSQPLGKIITLKEDSTGLYYESQIGIHSLGVDFVKMVESGLITEHSIGFQTVKSNKLADGTTEILEVKLWEGSSLTAWGANEKTPLTGMKAMTKEERIEKLFERAKSVEKFFKSAEAKEETIELLLIEHKQLTQMLFDELNNKSTEPKDGECDCEGEMETDAQSNTCKRCGRTPKKNTQPLEKDLALIIENFTNNLKLK